MTQLIGNVTMVCLVSTVVLAVNMYEAYSVYSIFMHTLPSLNILVMCVHVCNC